jgi:hypothetical protein
VDLGSSYYQKQQAQAAAESAALASAVYAKTNGVTCNSGGITCNSTLSSCSGITSSSSPVLYAGCQYAHQNGFPMSSISMAANTTTPPCAPCTSPSYWIQSQVSTSNHNLFLGIAGFPTAAIAASAVAAVTSSGGSGSGSSVPADCIWVLDPSDKQSFLISAASLSLSGCKAQVNSTATDPVNKQPSNVAANVNGSGSISPNNTGAVNVVGAGDYNQNYCPSGGAFTCGAASVANPLASLPALNETTQFGSTSCATGHTSQWSITTGTMANPTVVTPGIYCGGIHVSGGYVQFQTGGIFEMRGGGLILDNGTTVGTNVMFYLTATTPSASTANPVFTINTSNVTLSAPSSGTYQGILFFGNPTSLPQGPTSSYSQFAAGASPHITGTIYLPTGYLLYTGGAGSNSGNVALIVYALQINGASSFTWDSSGTYTGLATYGSSGATYTAHLIE